jgi:hypothetical protein
VPHGCRGEEDTQPVVPASARGKAIKSPGEVCTYVGTVSVVQGGGEMALLRTLASALASAPASEIPPTIRLLQGS